MRTLQKLLLSLVALVAVLFGALLITLQTDRGQMALGTWISQITDQKVEVERVRLSLLLTVELFHLRIKDVLEARTARFDLQPIGLFGGWVVIDHLETDSLILLDAPREESDLDWPQIPVGISISHFSLPMDGVGVQGGALIEPFGGDFSASVSIVPQEGQAGTYHLSFEGDARDREVYVTATVIPTEDSGLVQQLKELDLSVEKLQMHAFGKIDSWGAVIKGVGGAPEQQLLGDFTAELSDAIRVEGVFSIDGTRTLRLKPLVGKGEAFSLRGEAEINLNGEIAKANLAVHLSDISKLHPDLGGELDLKVDAIGTLAAPELQIELSGSEVLVRDHPVRNLEGHVTLVAWERGTASLSGMLQHLPVTASLQFAEEGPCWSVTQLQANAGASTLTGQFLWCMDGGIASGNLSGHIASLKEWTPIFNLDLEGNASFNLSLGPELQAQLNAPYLIVGPYQMTDVTADLTGDQLTARAAELSYNEVRFTPVDLALDGKTFTLNWQGDETDMNAGGSFVWDESLTVDRFEGQLFGNQIALAAPVTITRAGITPFKLTAGSGSIEGVYLPGDVQLTIRRFPLAVFELAFPKWPVSGTLHGDVSLSSIRLRWEDVELKNALIADLGAIHGHFSATIENERVTADLAADSEQGSPLVAHFEGPIKGDGPVVGEASFSGDLAPILQFVIPDTIQVGGQVAARIHLAGTADDPLLTGDLKIERGTMEDFYSGASLQDIEARLIGSGPQITLESLHATDGSGGVLTAHGSIDLQPEDDFPFQIDAEADNLQLVRLDVAEVRASGNATLGGTLSEPLLSGNLRSTDLLINIDKDLPSSVPSLNVTYINVPPSELRSTRVYQPVALGLDLTLEVPRKGRVVGMGVDSQWKGQIHVTGTFDRPLVHGSFGLVKGDLDFSGKAFTLTQGTISFDGSPEDTTHLDLVGTLKSGSVAINANLKGTIPDLKLTLFSTPPLSDAEILSHLLFNSPTDSLSAVQGIQLAQLSTKMAAGDYSDDPITSFQKGLGLDEFSITTGERGDSQEVGVAASKQLSKNFGVSVYRTLNNNASPDAEWPGRTTETPSFTSIEFNIYKEFRAGAEFASELGYRFIFVWQHDY